MKFLKPFPHTQIINETRNSNLVEVLPTRWVYHTSNPFFREKISREGLIPKGKSDAWLSDTEIDGEVIFAVNSNKNKHVWDSTYDDDIYRIDTKKLNNKWYNDPNFHSDGIHIITFEKIPVGAIELIYRGEQITPLSISMGHKKLNESYYNEEISKQEYKELLGGTLDPLEKKVLLFDSGEISRIKSLMEGFNLIHKLNLSTIVSPSSKRISVFNGNTPILSIEKIEDEWYLVTFHRVDRYWKCDSFDGLLKELRNYF